MTERLPHIRCFSCGKVLGNKWIPFQEKLAQRKPISQALNELGLNRMCCRTYMMSPAVIPSKVEKDTAVKDMNELKPRPKVNLLSLPSSNVPSQPSSNVPSLNVPPLTSNVPSLNVPPLASNVPSLNVPSFTDIDEGKTEVTRVYKAW